MAAYQRNERGGQNNLAFYYKMNYIFKYFQCAKF